jgi:alcohol dehydrogenase
VLAYVMQGGGRGSVQEVPEPTVGDYDAAVEMLVCGVCSSTDKMLRMGTFRMGVSYPSVLGHESVGRVVTVGERVRNLAVGDLVTRPSAYRPDAAPLDQYWGGFAERGVLTDWAARVADGTVGDLQPRWDQVRLPGDADPVQASLGISLSETFSVAVRHDLLGKTVAVVGTGIAGLSFVAYAKLLGAAHVVAVGRRAARLDLARRLGADEGVLAADAAARAAELGGIDLAFEASGQAEMAAAAYRWLKPGGACVVYSAPEDEARVDLFNSPRDATLSVASTHEAAVLPGMLRMVAGRVLDPDLLVSHSYRFADIERAFDDVAGGDVVKAMITFDRA